jgi:hypothetical protein
VVAGYAFLGALELRDEAPLTLPVVILFVSFGVVSVLFWAHFRFRLPATPETS